VSTKEVAAMTQPTCIVLDERLSIVKVAALHRTWCEHLAAGEPLAVDGSRVQDVDTAVLQLLCSAWRSCGERGISCVWQGVSDALRHAARLIGVEAALHLPEVKSVEERGDAAV
jgi:anti-anti-sigma regulatory factor